jgi:hypothetical protein
VVHPALDRVEVGLQDRHLEGRPPAVVADRLHGPLGPGGLSLASEEDDRADRVVPVGEDIGLDDHRLAHCALDREEAAVDRRPHALDDHSRRERRVCRGRLASCSSHTTVLRSVGWAPATVLGDAVHEVYHAPGNSLVHKGMMALALC